MFGSSPFGQSSSSPFGSPSVFGQAANAGSTNPFAPQPFGNTTLFGSQTGGSIFGGTSTGVFGAQSSPLGSNPVFGATSSAFGSSTPAFGASTSAFGSSGLGQKPAFGGFGSTTTQSSPFGGPSQQSQPAFGGSPYGSSTPFGAPSQPAFGTPSTPAFGATSSPAFGATSSPAFGASSTPAFGATNTTPFGSTSNTTFGSTGSAFGVSGSPLFGSSTPAFGASSTPAFGAASTPAFGASTTPAFGASTTPAFGTSNSPFSFGQSSSAFGSSPFGTTTSTPFGAQSSPFGSQVTTAAFGSSTFGQSGIGGQRGGTRVTTYAPTPEADGTGKLESVSAMTAYKDKSHEELRWEDYQLGDKGGSAPAGQSSSTAAFGNPGFGSTSTSTFNQSSPNLFSSTTSSNPFAPKTPGFNSTGFGSTSAPTFNSSPFAVSNTSNPFGSTPSPSPSPFSASASTFGVNPTPSVFGSSSSTGFATTPSLFNSSTSQGTISNFGTASSFGNTQSSPLFQSTTPSLGQGSLGFGQTNSAFGKNVSPFGQSNLFSSPSTGFGLSSTPTFQSQGFGQATTPSLSMPFQSSQPTQHAGTFSFSNFGQTQSAASSGFGITPSMYGQMQSTTQSSAIAQSMPVMNPYGTLPAMPQMSIGRTGTSSSIQYGISSLPVVDKPVPVKISSLLTSRHLTQRRIRLPARKYQSKSDGPKVPFFGDEEETPSTPKADALFIPRENPRALVVRPLDQWSSKLSAEKTAPSDRTPLANGNGKLSEAGLYPKINGTTTLDENECIQGEQAPSGRQNHKQNDVHEAANISEKEDSYITLTGHRAGEAAIVYEHGADIEALMPKLRQKDYYTNPRIQELAAKERAEPGFCRRVRDFVVGRAGYGSIKFIGETDIRRLDLENIVQFNNREVVVYPDESKKPPVGQGLNKAAEVTLLNIKFFNKKTGEQLTEGASVERCKDNLIKKSAEQGAEFLSYDPLKGEWKFRVNHFSVYKLEDKDNLEAELTTCG